MPTLQATDMRGKWDPISPVLAIFRETENKKKKKKKPKTVSPENRDTHRRARNYFCGR